MMFGAVGWFGFRGRGGRCWGTAGALASGLVVAGLSGGPAAGESASGITFPDDFSIVDKAYVWKGPEGFHGTFLYDNTQPTSFEDLEVSPVTELNWYTGSFFDPDSVITHSGQTMQYSQQASSFGTEVFFTGGQVGQDWFGLRFFTPEELRFTERPTSLEYKRSNPSASPIRWSSVEFQYTSENGLVQSVPVNDVYKVGLVRLNNDPPDLFAAQVNEVNGDLVLDEKPGSHRLTLDALATDAEGGALRFTIDGDGPFESVATGPGSTRASQTVIRTIPGRDTGGEAISFLFRVEDPTFGWMTVIRDVTVRNLDPVIESFEVSYEKGEAIALGETLAFSASASDPGRDALVYSWDLDDDGVFDDASGVLGSMLLDNPELTSIGLRVTDGDGGEAIQRHTLNIVPEPASASALLGLLGLVLRRRRV